MLHGNFADENRGVDVNLGGVLTAYYDFEFDLPAQRVRLYVWPTPLEPAATSPASSQLPAGFIAADCTAGVTSNGVERNLRFSVTGQWTHLPWQL